MRRTSTRRSRPRPRTRSRPPATAPTTPPPPAAWSTWSPIGLEQVRVRVQRHRRERPAPALPRQPRPRRGNYYYVINPAIAGPDHQGQALVRLQHRDRTGSGTAATPTPRASSPTRCPTRKGINKGTLKLTWQVNSRNKLSQPDELRQRLGAQHARRLGIEPGGAGRTGAPAISASGASSGSRCSPTTSSSAPRSAYSRPPAALVPVELRRHDPDNCDFIPCGRSRRSPRRHRIGQQQPAAPARDLNVYQAVNQLEWFAEQQGARRAQHQFKDQLLHGDRDPRRSRTRATRSIELNGQTAGRRRPPTTRTIRATRRPAPAGGSPPTPSAATTPPLSRQLAAHPLPHHHPGAQLRLDPGQQRARATPSSTPSAGRPASRPPGTRPTTAAPSCAAASASTWTSPSATPILAHPGRAGSQRCKWNTATNAYDKDCVFGGGLLDEHHRLALRPIGHRRRRARTACEKLKIPRTLEYTIGGEREIVQGIGARRRLRLPQVHQPVRDQRDQPHLEPRRQPERRSATATAARETVDGPRDARRRPPPLRRPHRRAQQARGPGEGARLVHLEQARGHRVRRRRATRGATSPAATSTSTAPCPTTTATRSRPRCSTRPPAGSSLGVRYSFHSGFPYNRLFRNDVTGNYENYRAERRHQPRHQHQRPHRRPPAAPARPPGAERPGRASTCCRSSGTGSRSTSTSSTS